jgi:hypothetical protein
MAAGQENLNFVLQLPKLFLSEKCFEKCMLACSILSYYSHDILQQLMFSEWMLEPPEDFPSEWLMMPCPVGRRNLVVASRVCF